MISYTHIKNIQQNIILKQTLFGMTWSITLGLLAYATEGRTVSFMQLFFLVSTYCCTRFSGMCWNRYIDRFIDAKNPRTALRPLSMNPQGAQVVFVEALIFLFIAAFSAMQLKPYTQCIVYPTFFLVILYSFTKRFTSLCHFLLGTILSMAPMAVWVELTGGVSWGAILFCVALFLSITGQDIIYACQDYFFDRSHKLHSIPVRFGIIQAVDMARILSTLSCILLCFSGYLFELSPLFYIFIGMYSFAYMVYVTALMKHGLEGNVFDKLFQFGNMFYGVTVLIGGVVEVLCVL